MNSSSLMPCPDCGANVSRNAYTCPQCGRKIRSTPINLIAKFVIGAVVAVVVVPILWTVVRDYVLPTPKNPDAEMMDRMSHERQEAYLQQMRDAQNAKKVSK
jgi:endogenous inhibitor of DNA gyrase (YacG/DUF329 family)